jgi:hypothetical protein
MNRPVQIAAPLPEPEPEPGPRVLVARIEDSPWPELAGGGHCHGSEVAFPEPAGWVVWTEQDTGDGMRLACDDHLGDWVSTVYGRLVRLPEPERQLATGAAAARLRGLVRALISEVAEIERLREIVSQDNETP